MYFRWTRFFHRFQLGLAKLQDEILVRKKILRLLCCALPSKSDQDIFEDFRRRLLPVLANGFLIDLVNKEI